MTEANRNNLTVHTTAILMAVMIFTVTGFASVGQAQDTTDYLGISGPISFQGVDHGLAWSSQASPDYIKQEYLPEGQTLDAYTDMLLVETVATPANVEAVVGQMVDTLNQRKASDPIVNYAILHNDAQSELVLDFVLSSQTPDGERIIEWNAYRYTQLPGDVPGILLLGISRRAYGDADAQTFMEGLGGLRNDAITALATMKMPEPTR